MVNPEKLKRVHDMAYAIVEERYPIYGDKVPPFEDNIGFAKLKIDRGLRTLDKDKKIDDLVDAMNYLAFAVLNLLEEENK